MGEQATPGRKDVNMVLGMEERFVLRLYVTGATSRSAKAISNIRRICDEYIADNYELHIVDIYMEPQAALEHQIIAAPTLVKVSPVPIRRLIGDLSNEERILSALGIQSHKGLEVK